MPDVAFLRTPDGWYRSEPLNDGTASQPANFQKPPSPLGPCTKASDRRGSRLWPHRITRPCPSSPSPSASLLFAHSKLERVPNAANRVNKNLKGSPGFVNNLLEGVKSYLHALRASALSEQGTGGESVSLSRRLFGKAPWSRKKSDETNSSISSSTRYILAGRTPYMTPASSHPTRSFILYIYFLRGFYEACFLGPLFLVIVFLSIIIYGLSNKVCST